MSYQLSQVLTGHERGVRSVCVLDDGVIVTGGEDGYTIVWMKESDDKSYVEEYRSMNHEGKMVVCVVGGTDSHFYSGATNKTIVKCDITATPVMTFIGHTNTVNSLEEIDNGARLLSGSWDGTVRLWNTSDATVLSVFEVAQHAICIRSLTFLNQPTLFVTGSHDTILRLFSTASESTKPLLEIESGHEQIIRSITAVPSLNSVVTTSNDGSLKLVSFSTVGADQYSLDVTKSYHTHGSFVFSSCVLDTETGDAVQFATSNEDGHVRILSSTSESTSPTQDIIHTKSVFEVVSLSTGRFLTACEDKKLRIFSIHPDEVAAEEVLVEERAAADAAEAAMVSKGARALSEDTIAKLPALSEMSKFKGTKVGQVKMFRSSDNKAMVCSWTGGKWDIVGEALGENTSANSISESREYKGDKFFPAGIYDFIFDVELGEGAATTPLPFNRGGNPLVAAESFAAREGISKSFVPQIVKFINDNTNQRNPAPAANPSKPAAPPAPAANSPTVPTVRPSVNAPTLFPLSAALTFPWSGKAVSSACEKLRETNSLLSSSASAADLAAADMQLFSNGDLAYLKDFENKIGSAAATDAWIKKGDAAFFRKCESELIYKRWASWLPSSVADGTKVDIPNAGVIAGIDICRVLALHPVSAEIHSTLDCGWWLISKILCQITKDNGATAVSAVGLRFFANMFELSSNRLAMLKNQSVIINTAITNPILNNGAGYNKLARHAASTVLLNFAQTHYSTTLSSLTISNNTYGRIEIAVAVLALLEQEILFYSSNPSSPVDSETSFRCLVALGILLSFSYLPSSDALPWTFADQVAQLRNFIKPQIIAKGIKELTPSLFGEERIKTVLAEIQTAWNRTPGA